MSKVCLISIDGWGIANPSNGNAITLANTPNMTKFSSNKLQYSDICANGLAVGLPDGLMGNSEVGHLTIGAGRIQYQDLVRINLSIENKSFYDNQVLNNALNYAKNNNNKLHLLGLGSDGGVHSHILHLYQFINAAKLAGIQNTYIHFFADGRDTSPTSGVNYISQIQDYCKSINYGEIVTVIGRHYAMDRDKRWERVKIAYEALIGGKNAVEVSNDTLIDYIKSQYNLPSPITDEFLTPIIVNKNGLISENDTLIFINFRADRMREIVDVLGMKSKRFESDVPLPNLNVIQMTQYNEKYTLPILYPPQTFNNVLAEWISKKGLLQFHAAETEKYAHVTFFFNGGREEGFENEIRCMVPSPKVATYDLEPEMSMSLVGNEMEKAMSEGKYQFVVCNLAAPDMVGHTGKLAQTIKAVEHCDKVIGEIYDSCVKHGYALVVTSDHGNAEEMIAEDGSAKTSHTTNYVPFVIANTDRTFKIHDGGLQDVAPTILDIMGLDIPVDMTGKSMV